MTIEGSGEPGCTMIAGYQKWKGTWDIDVFI